MIQEKIEQLIKPTIEDMGYTLWACEYLAQGRHSLLRIYIDKTDGVVIDDCERVSRQVSGLLDVENPISGHYTLEVSSPGIPRPLLHDWHYKNYMGKEVEIKLHKPINGKRKFKGVIVSIDADTVTLEIMNEQHAFLLSNIMKGHLTV